MTYFDVPATVTKVSEIVKSGVLSQPVKPIAPVKATNDAAFHSQAAARRQAAAGKAKAAAAQGVADRQARREARVAALLARRDSLHAELAKNMEHMGNTAWLQDRIELMASINADLAHEGWGPADVK